MTKRPALAPCDYLTRVIANGGVDDCDKWYPGGMPFLYAASRAYADGGASCLEGSLTALRAALLDRGRGGLGFGGPLRDCLGATALVNLGYEGAVLERTVARIRGRQGPAGNWPAEAFFHDAKRRYGSEALSTALCVEALTKAAHPRRGSRPESR